MSTTTTSVSTAAFRVAQSSLLNASTKQGTKLFNCVWSDVQLAATAVSTSVDGIGFALKLSRFRSFSNLGRSSTAWSGQDPGLRRSQRRDIVLCWPARFGPAP
ncbi:hypothetical protein GYH30_024767 [Glycine max]|nr:hypothetical protein GYH30_024767 [Glycine max]